MAEKGTTPMTVLIAEDDSPHSDAAFEWYLKHLHRPENEVILAFYPDVAESINSAYASAGPTAMMEMVVKGEGEADFVLKRLWKKLGDNGLKGRVERLHGTNAGSALVKAAEQMGASMVVVGSRGKGTIRRTLMGSVSQYVVHHSHVPVIVCRYHHHHHQVGHKE